MKGLYIRYLVSSLGNNELNKEKNRDLIDSKGDERIWSLYHINGAGAKVLACVAGRLNHRNSQSKYIHLAFFSKVARRQERKEGDFPSLPHPSRVLLSPHKETTRKVLYATERALLRFSNTEERRALYNKTKQKRQNFYLAHYL